jgi:hypothetical protein
LKSKKFQDIFLKKIKKKMKLKTIPMRISRLIWLCSQTESGLTLCPARKGLCRARTFTVDTAGGVEFFLRLAGSSREHVQLPALFQRKLPLPQLRL